MTTPTNSSPKPIPHIFNFNNLTTKKEKFSVTPKVRKIPPRPPCKSITKISRLSSTFNNSQSDQKAHLISFKNDSELQLSKLYDQSRNESYFKQCFIIEEKIGSGSFGDVFKVKSREDNKYYAVKISRDKFKGKLDREEKLNEVCKHEQLPKHDHLVKLYRAWEEKQRLYIQTELCATSLSALAETNHEISEETVMCYLVDLLKAIDHLHSNDLIHLDIKPENIFISCDDLIKLGDFGLVLDINNRQLNDATEGDPKYLASEVMQGIYTKAADIFSLGMTILELALDLDLPSRGQSWHMLRSGQIPDDIFGKMSVDLKNIILRMINPDYRTRPSAKELLQHPIIAQFEKKRRHELQMKKYLAWLHNIKLTLYNLWSRLLLYVDILISPLRNRFSTTISNKKIQNSPDPNSSPPNYNRAYVSNYLDQYSDDDSSDNRQYSLDMSPLNSKPSTSNSSTIEEDDSFEDFSTRNLCSTAYRNNGQSGVSRLSPFFEGNTSIVNNESVKSVAQRLTFEEFSSDEMELTENDEDDRESAPVQSNSISSANTNTSRLRLRQNITRKNLANTFDELNSSNT